MNFTTIKNVSRVMIFLSVLALLGIMGNVSPAFAAGSVTINGGKPVTSYQQVTLALGNPGTAAFMSIKNETDVSFPAFEAYAATKQWTLSPGAGPKKVSVQFKDSGNVTVGNVFATIDLDFIIDTSFNTKGFDTRPAVPAAGAANSVGKATAVDQNGKIVSVGTFAIDNNGNTKALVMRYNANGTIDTTFNGTGFILYGTETGAHKANAVAISPVDGKIAVVGTFDSGAGDTDVWVFQLNSDGTTDGTFQNGSSYVTGSPLDPDQGNAVAYQPDGKIVVVGTYNNGGVDGTSVWVMRLTAAGIEDPAFNGGTGVLLGGNIGLHSGNGVALQPDGKIVVTGSYDHGDGTHSIWVSRLKIADDTDIRNLDPTFGGRGTGENTFAQSGPLTSGNAVAIKGGMIYIAGTYDWVNIPTDAILLKLDSNGLPVDTFGGVNGLVAFGGDGADNGNALAIQADDKIVVAGTYDNSGSTSLIVNRFNLDGSPDSGLNNGASSYSFGTGGSFQGNSVALQADGRIVVVGKGDYLDGTSSILTLRLLSQYVTNLLTVNTVGTGSVTVFPGTLTLAGSTYSGNFAADPTVLITLTAIPAPGGAAFTNWTGDVCNGSTALTCVVTMELAHTLTANFSLPKTLTVSVSGAGTVSGPSSIACVGGSSANCSASFPLSTVVNLSATPAWYSYFTAWGGACSGSVSPCAVTMSQAKNVTATFTPNKNVRLNAASLYSTILDAYSGVASGATTATIDAQVFTFLENLQFGTTGLIVTLNGGLGAAFAPNVANNFTKVKGSLKINAGRLNARYIKVQ